MIKRKILTREDKNLPIIQIVGFGLILMGVTAIITGALWNQDCTKISSIISVAFFITLLGVSFAFPSLLEGNDGLSTMRIVVFMMVNVICMLLIKIGWDCNSLEEIKLDANWMGVIAFIFGAKATQSYFESRMAVPKSDKPTVGTEALEYTNAEIAKLAVQQNEQYLRVKFPNIVSISDAVHDLNKTESHVVTLYLKDNNTINIPDKLEVKMPDGKVKTIGTELVQNVGVGKIQVSQKSIVDTGTCTGSVCCVVDTNQGFNAVVTAGHVYSNDSSTNFGGKLNISDQTQVKIDDKNGEWIFQLINYKNDIAIARLGKEIDFKDYLSFKDKTHYRISDFDIKKTQVKLISNKSGERTGYVLDYNTSWDIEYSNNVSTKNNIIVVGNIDTRNNSKTLSQSGDSGGCVIELESGNLVGLILGGNDLFTWVLPIEEILFQNNYKLI